MKNTEKTIIVLQFLHILIHIINNKYMGRGLLANKQKVKKIFLFIIMDDKYGNIGTTKTYCSRFYFTECNYTLDDKRELFIKLRVFSKNM